MQQGDISLLKRSLTLAIDFSPISLCPVAGAARVLHPCVVLHHVPVCSGVADCGPQHSPALLQHVEVTIQSIVPCVSV